jgi:magnesium chelatase family protein
VAARVEAARRRQAARHGRTGVLLNADLPPRVLREVAAPDGEGEALLRRAMERLGLSARGHDRTLRLARTLADLEGAATVYVAHVAEALQFRGTSVAPAVPVS